MVKQHKVVRCSAICSAFMEYGSVLNKIRCLPLNKLLPVHI